MSNYLDYIFYRISKVYHKYDGDYGFTATFFLSLTEGIVLLDILILFGEIFFPIKTLRDSKLLETIIITVSLMPIIIINFFRYIKSKKRYPILKNKWENENGLSKFMGTILVIATLIAPWLILFIENRIFN